MYHWDKKLLFTLREQVSLSTAPLRKKTVPRVRPKERRTLQLHLLAQAKLSFVNLNDSSDTARLTTLMLTLFNYEDVWLKPTNQPTLFIIFSTTNILGSTRKAVEESSALILFLYFSDPYSYVCSSVLLWSFRWTESFLAWIEGTWFSWSYRADCCRRS